MYVKQPFQTLSFHYALNYRSCRHFEGLGYAKPTTALIEVNKRVEQVAKERGISMAQVSHGISELVVRVIELCSIGLLGMVLDETLHFGTDRWRNSIEQVAGSSRCVDRGRFYAFADFKSFAAGIHVKLTEEKVKLLEEPYEPRPIVCTV